MHKTTRCFLVRIEWGGFTAYMDSGLFPYQWNGGAIVHGGELKRIWQLSFKLTGHHFGIEQRVLLPHASWHSQTDNGLSGVLLEVEGNAHTKITVVTTQKTIQFTISELLNAGYLRWPVGAKYSGITIAAMLDGNGPFDVYGHVPSDGQDIRLKAPDFRGAAHYQLCKTFHAAWLTPGKTAAATFTLTRFPFNDRAKRSFFELECQLSLASRLDTHYNEDGTVFSPVEIYLNATPLPLAPVYFRRAQGSWKETQWLEFISIPVPSEALRKHNRLYIKHAGAKYFLIIAGAQLRETIRRNGEIINAPRWMLAGEEYSLNIFCTQEYSAPVFKCKNAALRPLPTSLKVGENRLALIAGHKPEHATIEIQIGANRLTKLTIPVFALKDEKNPWLVGPSLEHVRLDESHQADHIIQSTRDSQLGNYVQFRIEPTNPQNSNFLAAKPADWERWGELLRRLKIHFSVISGHGWKGYNLDGYTKAYAPLMEACRILKIHGQEFFFSTHVHEFSRSLYGALPPKNTVLPPAENTMTAAAQRFRDGVRAIITNAIADVPMQIGEAAPMAADDYAAGMEYVAVETMALNALHLFAAASGAARVFKKTWGIHNATYWCKAPDDFTKLTLNYLNWYLTYLWGGRFAISEDGHFSIPHSNRQQQFHSELPTRLREQIRQFYKFVRTHPRRGERETPIAIARGNGSCELASFPSKIADFRLVLEHVWGKFGATTPEWAAGDPERSMELLDVFMPYLQDGHHIRHWFAGTPYGPFDLTPIEYAPLSVLKNYPLLVFLGWNTMTAEIYAKLKDYVRQGGTLFCTLPHFSTQDDRHFLATMGNLQLINQGDLTDLCGVKIESFTEPLPTKERYFSAKWRQDGDAQAFTRYQHHQYVLGTRHEPIRLANVTLTSAKILVAGETAPNMPILVENRLGRGSVWLFTASAYPGRLSCLPLIRDVLHILAERTRKKTSVWIDDPSQEIAYACWRDGNFHNLYLLNTDWTAPNNIKSCRVHIGRHVLPIEVPEGAMRALSWRGNLAILPQTSDVFIADIRPENGRYLATAHGATPAKISFFGLNRAVVEICYEGTTLPHTTMKSTGQVDCLVPFGKRTRMELLITTAA